MRHRIVILVCGFLLALSGCSKVAITGRNQFNLIPDSTVNAMGVQAYKEFLAENKLSDDLQQNETVSRVGHKIQKAVEQYCLENGLSDILEGYKWQFNLVKDDAINAWAMPGGKVVVYTGLLPVAENEAGLAVVMGHEIAHVIARHGSERMTQGLVVKMGGMALSQALTKYPAQTQSLFKTSYSVGTKYGLLLPYSRTHESEADHMGLVFMAMAGYDPHEAVGFWKRMSAAKDSASSPELLSTHPADETRIKRIEELLPQAMEYYHKAMQEPSSSTDAISEEI